MRGRTLGAGKAGADPSVYELDLVTDLVGGTATVPTAFHTGSFTPKASLVVVTVGVTAATGGGNAVDVAVVIGATTYPVGTLNAATNETVTRTLRLSGLTPGTPVAWSIIYSVGAGGAFYCRPSTVKEYASLVAERAV